MGRESAWQRRLWCLNLMCVSLTCLTYRDDLNIVARTLMVGFLPQVLQINHTFT